VAYLRTADHQDNVHLSFLMARSRVVPKRLHSMPRLELCAAVTGAQLLNLIQRELTLKINQTILWTDSSTWLQSESCRYKVFVGTSREKLKSSQTITTGGMWIQRGTLQMTSPEARP